jgi:sulfatase modifying factor 1
MVRDIEWKLVRGGRALYGDAARPRAVPDLLWSATPVTWIEACLDQIIEDPYSPLVQLNQYQAIQFAERFHARLPTSVEWEWMAAGLSRREYPWGDEEWNLRKANLHPSANHKPVRVGSFPEGATPEGILDVAGNVWEWTSSRVAHGGGIIRGGSYRSKPLYARTRFINAVPCELSSNGIGVRLVKSP